MSDTVVAAGVYEMSNEEYQADPVPGGSLSRSGAAKLLPPSCPALYKEWAASGSARTREFDLGHAAHSLVLGVGEPLAVVDADDWRTKAAREKRDEARAQGYVPILRADYDMVQSLAGAVRAHPIARALFNPDHGRAEQSLFWQSDDVWLRARLDWLPEDRGRRMIVPDLKTTKSAEPEYLRRAMFDYGYYSQAAWYLDAITALELGEDPAFVLVFVEKTPPYLVTVCEPDAEAVHWGRARNQRAVEIYRECKANDHWPGYADDVIPLSLPRWAAYQLEEV